MNGATPVSDNTPSSLPADAPPGPVLETLFGQAAARAGWLKSLQAKLPGERWVFAVAAALGALLFVPYLGAVGLWDPWETHYGEVGRMMIQRSDYVYPYWESAWFFSKPPLTMWMQALGMQVAGTNRTEGALALYTEWGMRLPFALLSMLALGLLGYALARVLNRRVAYATVFVLATMPLYFLLTRQAVTDTPFVCCFVSAMACALVGQFDKESKHRSAWWYGFWIFSGLGLLAKELIGVGFPLAVLFLYACIFVVPWNMQALGEHLRWLQNRDNLVSIFLSDVESVRRKRTPPPVMWQQFFDMRVLTGSLVMFMVFGPWLLVMSLFEGVDEESKTFAYRFFIHDNINRLFAGVHTTTPGGSFTYFIEQGGFAIFPWVALVPGALAVASRIRIRSTDLRDHVAFIAVVWVAFAFYLFSSSATKFHHYVFPLLPAVAVLVALFIDRLWEEGLARHGVPLMLGAALFVLVGKDLSANPKNFTDLFVYNYDRAYPMKELIEAPLQLGDALKPLRWLGRVDGGKLLQGHVYALMLLPVGLYLVLETLGRRGSQGNVVKARFGGLTLVSLGVALLSFVNSPATVTPLVALGVAVGVSGGYLAAFGRKEGEGNVTLATLVGAVGLALVISGLNRPPATDPLRPLLLDPVNIKEALGLFFGLGAVAAIYGLLSNSRPFAFGAFGAFALAFALWFNWSHWVDLSHHWTQRDQFWRYYAHRAPGEPITAFLMNWRGETFYSRNTVKQIKENGRLRTYADQPGREWALVEHYRFNILKNAVGPDKNIQVWDKELNNKFVLVTIEGP